MDPATIAMAAQAINLIATTIQQYSAGTITQEEAHAQLVAAFGNVKSAIDDFNSAGGESTGRP